jgi:hypothetical protein
MGRGFMPIRHALQMYNAEEQCINGTGTTQDLDGARRLAQSVLRLCPTVAYIEIFVCDDAGRLASGSVARVDWDQEWARSA